MTAEQALSHPLRRKGFALATLAAAAVGVSAFALAAAAGDLSGGAKIRDGGGAGAGLVGLFGTRRAAGSPSSSSSGAAAVREGERHQKPESPCALARARNGELDSGGADGDPRRRRSDTPPKNKIDGALLILLSPFVPPFPPSHSLSASTSSQVPDWGFMLPYGCVVFPAEEQEREQEREPRCVDPKKAEPFFFFAHPSLLFPRPRKRFFFFSTNSPASGANRARILAEIREENDWKTDFVLGKRAGAALR